MGNEAGKAGQFHALNDNAVCSKSVAIGQRFFANRGNPEYIGAGGKSKIGFNNQVPYSLVINTLSSSVLPPKELKYSPIHWSGLIV